MLANTKEGMMKLDTTLAVRDLTEVAAYARAAEEIGFDTVWSTETQHDPFLPLAVAATTTRKVKLGTAIAVERSGRHLRYHLAGRLPVRPLGG